MQELVKLSDKFEKDYQKALQIIDELKKKEEKENGNRKFKEV